MFALDSVNETKELEKLLNLHKTHQTLDLCIHATNKPQPCPIANLVRGQPIKNKVNMTNKKPIAFVQMNSRIGKRKRKTIKVLLDSGASASVLKRVHAKKLKIKNDRSTTWTTPSGTMRTNATAIM